MSLGQTYSLQEEIAIFAVVAQRIVDEGQTKTVPAWSDVEGACVKHFGSWRVQLDRPDFLAIQKYFDLAVSTAHRARITAQVQPVGARHGAREFRFNQTVVAQRNQRW